MEGRESVIQLGDIVRTPKGLYGRVSATSSKGRIEVRTHEGVLTSLFFKEEELTFVCREERLWMKHLFRGLSDEEIAGEVGAERVRRAVLPEPKERERKQKDRVASLLKDFQPGEAEEFLALMKKG